MLLATEECGTWSQQPQLPQDGLIICPATLSKLEVGPDSLGTPCDHDASYWSRLDHPSFSHSSQRCTANIFSQLQVSQKLYCGPGQCVECPHS